MIGNGFTGWNEFGFSMNREVWLNLSKMYFLFLAEVDKNKNLLWRFLLHVIQVIFNNFSLDLLRYFFRRPPWLEVIALYVELAAAAAAAANAVPMETSNGMKQEFLNRQINGRDFSLDITSLSFLSPSLSLSLFLSLSH